MRKRQLLFIRHVKRTHLQQITFLFLIPQRNSYAEQMERLSGMTPDSGFSTGSRVRR